MHSVTSLVLLASIPAALSTFLGPVYPSPTDLSSNDSVVSTAFQNVTAQLDTLLGDNSDETAALRNLTFSVNVFSVHDPATSEQLQYHYTGPQVRDSPYGTNQVNADSIYHVASVTKLFSVYTALLAMSPEQWQTPLSLIFPEFVANVEAAGSSPNPIYTTQWDKITPYMLAAQLSDLPKDGPAPLAGQDLLAQLVGSKVLAGLDPYNISAEIAAAGLPPVNLDDPKIFPPCAFDYLNISACPVDQWVNSLSWQDPSFPAFTEPNYSNTGFILFGATIARLTNKTLDQLYNEYLFEPLGMDSSHIIFPGNDTLDRCVISGDYFTWTAPPGQNSWAAGSGFIMTSPNDLAKLGISIMNSTLLDPIATNKWLKPISHTSNSEYAVGMPWEIIRYTSPETGKITDIYPKSGDSGDWTAVIALIPDLKAGFSVSSTWTTTAGFNKLLAVSTIADILINTLMPALESQAAAEAEQAFVGTYVSTDPNLNSSITITRNSTAGAWSGLLITEWISNGTDMIALPALTSIGAGNPVPLQMTTDTRNPSTGTGQVAFRAPTYYNGLVDEETLAQMGLYTKQWTVGEWYSIGYPRYAAVGLDLFVFDITEEGKATTLSPAGLRVKLDKE